MTNRKPSVDRLTLKHFWQVSLSFRKEFLLSWTTIVSAIGITIAVPYFIGKILGNLVISNTNVSSYIYALVVVSIVSITANYVSYRNLFLLEPKVMGKLQTEALQALLKRGASFHNNRVSGKLVSDAADYPNAYLQLANTFFIDGLPFLMVIIVGITLVSFSSPLIGAVILGMSILTIGSTIRFRIRMAPRRVIRQAASKELTSHLADTIVNNQTVKSFGNETDELARHKILNDRLISIRYHDWHEMTKDGSLRIFWLLLFQIIFILVVVYQVRNDPTLLATGIFAFSFTMTLSNRLFQIGNMMRAVEEALLLAMPMTEMLQEVPEILDKPGADRLEVRRGAIDFQKVSFYYTDNSRHDKVFSHLNLHVSPGEKIGLVGPSGGGKSTFTKLLLRFENIQEGRILIDNQDILYVTQTSLRQAIAYVPQEPLLFHRTVKENIAYGKPGAQDADIVHASAQAHADEFIKKLPKGYNTIVGERGVKLSGGQRQRIAIARAILKDAPILMLDEATSALDSESEAAIQAALWELMQNRTAVVIAHRLSTIQRLNRIVVLDGGKIIEQGTHTQLLEADGLYAKLWSHQSGGFIDD